MLKAFPFRPTIDLFTLQTYVSWKRDPFARYMDAFTVNWVLHQFYAFPQFTLVHLCFQKSRGDGATGLLIVPKWLSLSYFVSLLSMLVAQLLFFKATRTTLMNPSVRELIYTLRVALLVYRVSDNPLSSASFSTQVADVSLSSWRKSTVKQYNVYLEKWSTFCL